ncbi:MAG: hypothetical protein IPI64_07535 [Chloracidobacterium sp.]|nr:hypothetical protein [Chloracidobacterium sp.]
MSLFDLFIIYFAAGAPFGVYKVTTLKGAVTVNVVIGLLLQIVLWPVFTVRMLVGDSGSAEAGNELDRLQSEIEHLAFTDGSASAIFDFREVFARYTGLSQAANVEVGSGQVSDIFEIGKSENPQLATAILARRNREKLIFHQMTARNEFVDVISGLAIDQPEVIALATQVAVCVKDELAIEELAALTSHSSPSNSKKDHPVAIAA